MRHSVLDTHQFFIGDGLPGSQNDRTFVADAYTAMRLTAEYLWRIHGRQGLDGNNGPRIRIETRSPEVAGNVQWLEDKNRIIVAPDNVDHYDYASVDVIAHEIGHGLDSYGPNMAFVPPPPCQETNKIMEATADMFSMLASASIEPSGHPYRIMEHPKKANWNGAAFTSNVAERYLDDPTINNKPACHNQFIACMNGHEGSSPASHMFYLLTYGGTSACNGNTVNRVGVDLARDLFDQMFFQELPPNASYAFLKSAFLDAAFVLDGNQAGPTHAATQAAFAAINMP